MVVRAIQSVDLRAQFNSLDWILSVFLPEKIFSRLTGTFNVIFHLVFLQGGVGFKKVAKGGFLFVYHPLGLCFKALIIAEWIIKTAVSADAGGFGTAGAAILPIKAIHRDGFSTLPATP